MCVVGGHWQMCALPKADASNNHVPSSNLKKLGAISRSLSADLRSNTMKNLFEGFNTFQTGLLELTGICF